MTCLQHNNNIIFYDINDLFTTQYNIIFYDNNDLFTTQYSPCHVYVHS